MNAPALIKICGFLAMIVPLFASAHSNDTHNYHTTKTPKNNLGVVNLTLEHGQVIFTLNNQVVSLNELVNTPPSKKTTRQKKHTRQVVMVYGSEDNNTQKSHISMTKNAEHENHNPAS